MRRRLYLLTLWVFTTLTALSLGVLIWSGFATAKYRWQGGVWEVRAGEISISAAPRVRWNPKVLGFEYSAFPTRPFVSLNSKVSFQSLSEFDLRLPSIVPALVFGTAAALALYRVRRPFDRGGRVSRRGSFRKLRWTLTGSVAFLVAASTASEWMSVSRSGRSWSFGWGDGRLLFTTGSYFGPPLGWSVSAHGEDRYESEGIFLIESGTPDALWGDDYWVAVSTWGLAFLLAIPGAMLWHIHLRKYPSSSVCSKCHYDRTGLAAGAACPECGVVAPTQA